MVSILLLLLEYTMSKNAGESILVGKCNVYLNVFLKDKIQIEPTEKYQIKSLMKIFSLALLCHYSNSVEIVCDCSAGKSFALKDKNQNFLTFFSNRGAIALFPHLLPHVVVLI